MLKLDHPEIFIKIFDTVYFFLKSIYLISACSHLLLVMCLFRIGMLTCLMLLGSAIVSSVLGRRLFRIVDDKKFHFLIYGFYMCYTTICK